MSIIPKHEKRIEKAAQDLLKAVHASPDFKDWVEANEKAVTERQEHEMTGASYRITVLPTSVGTCVTISLGNGEHTSLQPIMSDNL